MIDGIVAFSKDVTVNTGNAAGTCRYAPRYQRIPNKIGTSREPTAPSSFSKPCRITIFLPRARTNCGEDFIGPEALATENRHGSPLKLVPIIPFWCLRELIFSLRLLLLGRLDRSGIADELVVIRRLRWSAKELLDIEVVRQTVKHELV